MKTKTNECFDNSEKILIGGRLKIFRESLGLSQSSLSKKLNIKQSTISAFETGFTFPNIPVIVFYIKKFGLSERWLFTGEGPLRRDPKVKSPSTFTEFTMVPEISPATCGNSGAFVTQEVLSEKAFESDWLRQFKEPLLTRAMGDSMSPVILDGDLLLVDRNQEKRLKPDPGKFYLVNAPETIEDVAVMVKKVCLSGKSLVLMPLNPSYPPLMVDLHGRSILSIVIGEVVWIGRELIHGNKLDEKKT